MRHITSIQELTELINKHHFIVIDFYAQWCGPCKRISPAIDDLSKERPDVMFVKVDIDDVDEELRERFMVSVMPTFIFLQQGHIIGCVEGADLNAIKEKLGLATRPQVRR
jgi:thioredoxin 1